MCFKVRETHTKQLCIERLMNIGPAAYKSLTLDFPRCRVLMCKSKVYVTVQTTVLKNNKDKLQWSHSAMPPK